MRDFIDLKSHGYEFPTVNKRVVYIEKSYSKLQKFQMKSIYTFFFPLAIARPGLLTSLENFGQIMEENILKIINNPTGIYAQAI